jgi:hypothetical protein
VGRPVSDESYGEKSDQQQGYDRDDDRDLNDG